MFALLFLKEDHFIKLFSKFSFHRIYNESTIMLSLDVQSLNLDIVYFRILFVIYAVLLSMGIVWVTTQKAMNDGSMVAKIAKNGLFILMGAIWGNAVDRIFRPLGVVDFIRIDVNKDLAPIINVADIMIYVGVLFILIAWSILIANIARNLIINYVNQIDKKFKS